MSKHPKIELVAHLSSEELKPRYRSCQAAKEARRWHLLWLFSTDMPISSIARLLGIHRNWVGTVIKRYNADGPASVIDQHVTNPGGRVSVLNTEQEQALQTALTSRPADGGQWTGLKVAAWIKAQTGRARVYPQLGWVYLRKLGFTPQVPRPRHHEAASPEAQIEWKKTRLNGLQACAQAILRRVSLSGLRMRHAWGSNRSCVVSGHHVASDRWPKVLIGMPGCICLVLLSQSAAELPGGFCRQSEPA
jgi:transposase